MDTEEKIVLQPIGHVKTDAVDDEVRDKIAVSQIILNGSLVDGLDGIDGFSHLFVLFWLNQISSEQRKTLKVHPRGRQDLPLTGVFAPRSPARPRWAVPRRRWPPAYGG